jgi:F-type H+-transporting ATPase subunit b
MLIDWFTVAAQIVNFLVLVWLLKRFLYGRILRAIDARESKIVARVAEAEAKEAQAAGQLALYQAKLSELDQQRESMLAQARLDAEQQHASMLEKAREEVSVLEAKWQEELGRNRQEFLLHLRGRAATEVLTMARRVIADLTSTELEQSAIQVFLKKIQSLEHVVWTRIGAGDLIVRSGLELPEDQRARIQDAVEERLGRPVKLHFESAPAMGVGLELRGNGWRVAWNSESYLQALEEDLNEALNMRAGCGAVAVKAGT